MGRFGPCPARNGKWGQPGSDPTGPGSTQRVGRCAFVLGVALNRAGSTPNFLSLLTVFASIPLAVCLPPSKTRHNIINTICRQWRRRFGLGPYLAGGGTTDPLGRGTPVQHLLEQHPLTRTRSASELPEPPLIASELGRTPTTVGSKRGKRGCHLGFPRGKPVGPAFFLSPLALARSSWFHLGPTPWNAGRSCLVRPSNAPRLTCLGCLLAGPRPGNLGTTTGSQPNQPAQSA